MKKAQAKKWADKVSVEEARKNYKKIILECYKSGEFTFEKAMEEFAKMGYCFNLLNDDNGHWAIGDVGFQNVASGKSPIDIQTSFFVEKKFWKNSIKKAFVYFMKDMLK